MYVLTLAWLDHNGHWIVPGPHEGGGQGKRRDVQVAGEKILLTHRATPR